MSFFEDLGNAVGLVGSTVGDAASMAYDVALLGSTPGLFRSEEDKRATLSDLTSQWKDLTGKAGRAAYGVAEAPVIGDVAKAQYWLYSNAVSQPISASMLFAQGHGGNSWAEAENVSPAQAAASGGGFGGVTGRLLDPVFDKAREVAYENNVFGDAGREFVDEHMAFAKPDFDVTDPEQREEAFSDQAIGRLGTWAGDTAISWYADPFRLAGLGAAAKIRKSKIRAPRNKTDLAAMAEQAYQHDLYRYSNGAEGAKTPFGQFVEDTTKLDQSHLINDSRIRSSSRPDLMAGLLGNSTDYRTNALIVRAASGDDAARLALKDLDIGRWDSIETAAQGLTQEQMTILSKIDDAQLMERLDDGTFKLNPDWELLEGIDAAHIDDLSKIFDDAMAKDPWMTKLVDMASEPSPVMGEMGWRSVWAQEQATRRTIERTSRKLGDSPTTKAFWNVEDFKAQPFGRTMRVFSWLGDESPSGWVNLRGPSAQRSGREIQAALSKVRAWRGAEGAAKRQFWMNKFLDANTSSERAGVIVAMERDVIDDVAKHRLGDLSDVERKSIVDSLHTNHVRLRESAKDHLGRRGFWVEPDGTLAKAPELESHLAQAIPVADFGMYDSLLSRHGSTWRKLAGDTKDIAHGSYDALMAVWRPLVLFRLGYTQRNVAESSLRAAAYLQGSFNADHWAVSAGRAARNTAKRGEHLIVGTGHRVQNLPPFRTEQRVRRTLSTKRLERNALGRELDDLAADERIVLRDVPRGPEAAFQSPGDYYRLSEPQRFTQTDIETAIASPSGSMVNKGERRAFIDQQAGASVEPELILSGRRKAVARLAGEKKREGFQLGYLDENGAPVLVNKIKDLPDHVLEQSAIHGADAAGGVLFWEKHSKIVRGAVERGEHIHPSVFGHYRSRGALRGMDNAETETMMRYSEEALRQRSTIRGRMDDLDREIDDLAETLNWRDARERLTRKRRGTLPDTRPVRGGQGPVVIDGQRYHGAFEGPVGDSAVAWSSGAPRTAQELAGPNSFVNRRAEIFQSWGRIEPGHQNYWDSLARVVNRQVPNDPVMGKILEGWSPTELRAWARSKQSGDYLKRMGLKRLSGEELETHFHQLGQNLQAYVPSRKVWDQMRQGRRISAKELRNELSDHPYLRPIHGKTAIDLGGVNSVAEMWNRVTRKGFRYLGNIPEDVAARHPFYRSIYEDELRRSSKLFREQNGNRFLTGREQAGLEKAAHSRALKELQDTLYTIERYSNGAASLRLFFPFFASWANSLRVWTRLGARNPAIAAEGMLVYQSPNRAGLIHDADGNKVGVGEGGGDDEYINLNVPVIGGAGSAVRQVTEGLNRARISKHSANIIFQGEPWWNPGSGPILQIPASELVKRQPTWGQAMKTLGVLPFGASREPGSFDFLLPAWMKKQYYKMRGMDSVAYSNSVASFMQIQIGRYERGERETKPTLDEAIDSANNFWTIRMAANLILPAAPNFQSPVQFYIDEYRRLQREDSSTANERFLQMYPDHPEVMTSLSKNVSGMQSSTAAHKRTQKYKSLIADVGALDPSLVSLVTNGPSDYQFDENVYGWQFQNRIGPGSEHTFRESQSPDQVAATAYKNKGWTQYIKLSDRINAILSQRGLTSLQQAGAEDLAEIKTQFIATLGRENPDWYYDYQERDAAKAEKAVDALDQIVSNEDFMASNGDDPKWVSVAQYLDARDRVYDILQSRRDDGGSATLSAQSNEDVAEIWGGIVNYLSKQNTDFADLQARYLEQDDLGMVPG